MHIRRQLEYWAILLIFFAQRVRLAKPKLNLGKSKRFIPI